MNRKTATLSLGIVCLMFVFALTIPASATFNDTTEIVLVGTTDTSSLIDTSAGFGLADSTSLLIDAAVDDSGQVYIVHTHNEGGDTRILISKIDHNGTFIKVLNVTVTPDTGRVRRLAITVNKKSQAIYVAAASESWAMLYTDTGPQSNDSFTAARIPFRLSNMDTNFGSIDVTTFGSSPNDSVYVVGITDSRAGADGRVSDSGVMLWRFSPTGSFVDSALLYYRLDSGLLAPTSVGDTIVSLNARIIPSKVMIEAIDSNKIAVLVIGPKPFNNVGGGGGTDTPFGLYYDTFQILGTGASTSAVTSDTGVDTIAVVSGGVDNAATSAFAQAVMAWDATNSRVVIYYATRGKADKLRKAYVSGYGHYSASNDSDVDDNLSSDTLPAGLSLRIQKLSGQSLKEYLAFRSLGNGNIYYIKREADAVSTNVDFDTVTTSVPGLSSDSGVVIGVSNEGSPRIAFARPTKGEVFIHGAKPQGAAVSASSGITVINSQTVSSTSSPTLTISPNVSNTTTEMTQVALTATPASTKTSSTISDFTTPSYQVAIPLGSSSGDTMTVQVNSTASGLCVYLRKYADTDPSNGNIGSTGSLDTTVFGGLTDTQFTLCAATLVKVRMGDTAGNVFADNAISDTLAIRVKIDFTPALLAVMNAAGIDTRNLTVWKRDNGASKFTQLGNSTNLNSTNLNAGLGVSVTSATFTSFSDLMGAPGVSGTSGASGGICLITRYVGSTCPLCTMFRQARDTMMSSKIGRVLTSIYYHLN